MLWRLSSEYTVAFWRMLWRVLSEIHSAFWRMLWIVSSGMHSASGRCCRECQEDSDCILVHLRWLLFPACRRSYIVKSVMLSLRVHLGWYSLHCVFRPCDLWMLYPSACLKDKSSTKNGCCSRGNAPVSRIQMFLCRAFNCELDVLMWRTQVSVSNLQWRHAACTVIATVVVQLYDCNCSIAPCMIPAQLASTVRHYMCQHGCNMSQHASLVSLGSAVAKLQPSWSFRPSSEVNVRDICTYPLRR